jgi:hypothetical protein
MKPLDHFTRGEALEQEQVALSPPAHPATIIGACHAAAHHFISRAWSGREPRMSAPGTTTRNILGS